MEVETTEVAVVTSVGGHRDWCVEPNTEVVRGIVVVKTDEGDEDTFPSLLDKTLLAVNPPEEIS